jgi:hypothetical protein
VFLASVDGQGEQDDHQEIPFETPRCVHTALIGNHEKIEPLLRW